MLHVRLDGCGWSNDLGRVASLRVEGDALHASQHGEIARYKGGYWCASDRYFISVLVTPTCFVDFHNGDERSSTFGPYRIVRCSGGALWVGDSHERLLAKWNDAGRGWHRGPAWRGVTYTRAKVCDDWMWWQACDRRDRFLLVGLVSWKPALIVESRPVGAG
jgi:hypothetical protein